VCWTKETLGGAVGEFRFLPLVSELKAFLEPFALRLRAKVVNLDRVARADPATASGFRTGPAREAKGYVLPPPPPERETRIPLHRSGKEIPEPIRTVEEQLTVLGFTRETVPPEALQAADASPAVQRARAQQALRPPPPAQDAAD
jgi:hypothetical protein